MKMTKIVVLYNIILCHTIRYYCIFCVYIFNLNYTKQYAIYILYDTLLYYMIVYDIMSYHSTIDNASIKIINFDFDHYKRHHKDKAFSLPALTPYVFLSFSEII